MNQPIQDPAPQTNDTEMQDLAVDPVDLVEGNEELANTLSSNGKFKLLQAVLVDSLSPGRVVHFELEGGAVLTGRNGRGKTSMLNFLLMFYGVNPNELVSPGKDSFIQYYLPRATSYIAFEYERNDGQKRMVIAYANSNGEKVFYRFVRGGFDHKIFVNADKNFVEAQHLKLRLTELSIQHARQQIETYSDYRAVIQFSIPKTSDRRQKEFIKELAYDYAFTSYNKPLTHMDRLALGMFSRESNFEDLQSIVIDTIAENLPAHSIQMDRNNLEEWPRKYRAYLGVMSERETYDAAIEDKKGYDDRRSSLSDLHQKILLLIEHMRAGEARQAASLLKLKGEIQQSNTEHMEGFKALEKESVALDYRRDELATTISAIVEKKKDYDKEDIPSRVAAYQTKGSLENDQASLKAQIRALTGDFQSIKAEFQTIQAEVREDGDKERQIIHLERDASIKAFNLEMAALDERQRTEHNLLEHNHTVQREQHGQEMERLSVAVGVATQEYQNPSVSQDLRDKDAQKDVQLGHLRKSSSKAEETHRECERTHDRSRAAHEQTEVKVTKAKAKVVQCEEALEQVVRSSKPEAGSLLSFLHSDVQGWGATIAKVLRKDVLLRTDLSPVMGVPGEGVYGLELDLSSLEALPESNPQFMQDLIKEAEETLQASKDLVALAIAGRDESAATLKAGELKMSEAFNIKVKARDALRLAETEKSEITFKINNALMDVKQQALVRLDAAKAEQQSFRDKVALFEAQHAQIRNEVRSRYATLKGNSQAEFDSLSARMTQQLEALQEKVNARIRELDAHCAKALKEKGVDTDAQAQLQAQIEAIDAKLSEMKAYHRTMLDWVSWHKGTYQQLPNLQADLATKEGALLAKKEEISAFEAAHAIRAKALADALVAAENELNALQQQIRDGQVCSDKLVSFKPSQADLAFDDAWTIPAFTLLMRDWLADLKRHTSVMEAKIFKIKKSFEAHINSPVHDSFTFYVQHHTIESPVDYLPYFKVWYEGQHKDIFVLLRQTAKGFSDEVTQFYNTLKTFNERLNKFNRDLQEHLVSYNNDFDSISGLNITIHSTVDELKFWGVLKRIVESRSLWIYDEEKLPDHEFVEGMQALLGNWELKRGISADFKHLINVRGSVVENGNLRTFRRSVDLKNVSSNGLSYIILVILFIAFWSKIRKDAPVCLVWALDELKAIDAANISGLCSLMARNQISLASAFPDADVETIRYFKHNYQVEPDRRLAKVKIGSGKIKGASQNV